MNILILSTKMPWPPKDGGAIATLNLAGGLARNGANVTLLAMNTSKHYFNPDLIPGRIKDLIHIISVDVDTRIRPLNLLANLLFSSYPYIADRFRSEPYLKELERCLRETDFDIVQIEGPYLEYCIPSIRGHSIISLRAHNLEYRIWALRAKEEKNPARRYYFRSLSSRIFELEKKLLREIDLLVPISDTDAEGFRNMQHNLPVSVCPTGLDLADYPAGPTGGDIRLFYIGALDWAPNQEGLDWFFSKTWPAILSEWPNTVLHVAGRNSSQYFYGTTPPNVYPEGEVEDAIRFYREHSVMIVPLLSGSGIRIKILEAMAMSRVVISSSTGAAGLGVRDGEHLFIANQPEDYLRILGMLHKQPNLMQEIGHKARQFVMEKFDNLVLSGNLISFYKAQLT
jgi:glycosyltransferase involved in cell wall biosynthesis